MIIKNILIFFYKKNSNRAKQDIHKISNMYLKISQIKISLKHISKIIFYYFLYV